MLRYVSLGLNALVIRSRNNYVEPVRSQPFPIYADHIPGVFDRTVVVPSLESHTGQRVLHLILL